MAHAYSGPLNPVAPRWLDGWIAPRLLPGTASSTPGRLRSIVVVGVGVAAVGLLLALMVAVLY